MYDINFIRTTNDIKKQIVTNLSHKYSADDLYVDLERYRNKNPYLFNFETTNYCNMACVMCPRTKLMTREIKNIGDQDFNSVLGQIKPHRNEEIESFWEFVNNEYGINGNERSENAFYFYIISNCIALHGYGEPLLDPNIIKRVKSCNQKGFPTYFSCVPANIKPNKIYKLMDSGLDVIKFSLDALDDEGQKRVRGKNNNFQQSFNSILDILEYKKANPDLKTKIVITLISLGSSLDDIKMQKEFVKLWGNYPVYAYIKSLDNKWYYHNGQSSNNYSHYIKQYCEFPWTSLSIMSDGSVVPCTQDYDAEMNMGNIKEQSLYEIWNGKKYSDFRMSHITGNFPKNYKCKDRCDLPKIFERNQPEM